MTFMGGDDMSQDEKCIQYYRSVFRKFKNLINKPYFTIPYWYT